MNDARCKWELSDIPVNDERWALVQRVVASHCFAKAPQLRDFLLYITSHFLTNREAEINEYRIGSSVLGRRPDFEQAGDNIVRVQARHLRKKLEDYFASEGLREPLLIIIPKGAYVPCFEPRAPLEDTVVAVQPETRSRRGLWLLCALAIALAVSTGAFWWKTVQLQKRVESSPAPPSPAAHALWPLVFAKGQPTNIVVADTCLVMLQDILHSDITLKEYATHSYPSDLLAQVRDPQLKSALELISKRQYTSLGDVNAVSSLLPISARYGAKGAIRYSRHLNIREFKTDNFILVGSRRGVPWVQLFETKLNFSLERSAQSDKFIYRNKSPLPGEREAYATTGDASGPSETYSLIALLPNLGKTGNVLLLAGLTMVGTEAAGEFVATQEFADELAKRLPSRPGEPQKYFEMLIRTKAVGGAARETDVMAARVPGATATARVP